MDTHTHRIHDQLPKERWRSKYEMQKLNQFPLCEVANSFRCKSTIYTQLLHTLICNKPPAGIISKKSYLFTWLYSNSSKSFWKVQNFLFQLQVWISNLFQVHICNQKKMATKLIYFWKKRKITKITQILTFNKLNPRF